MFDVKYYQALVKIYINDQKSQNHVFATMRSFFAASMSLIQYERTQQQFVYIILSFRWFHFNLYWLNDVTT